MPYDPMLELLALLEKRHANSYKGVGSIAEAVRVERDITIACDAALRRIVRPVVYAAFIAIETILICVVAIAFVPVSWAQAAPTSESDVKASSAANMPPPYDRLELLASISAEMSSSYLISEVRERVLDFTADQQFLDAILAWHASTSLIGVIEDAKPRAKHTSSAKRQKAYEILVGLNKSTRDPSNIAKFQSALALAPDSAALHLAFAEYLLLVPDYPTAEAEARQSIRLWPGNAEAHAILAASLIGQDRSDAGIPEARQALTIYPDDRAALVTLGLALWRDRDFREAVPVLREAISRNPSMAFLHKDLGISLFNTGDIESAINEYVTFLQASPNDADGHYQLGVAFRAQGHKDDAQAQFRECARLNPSQLVCVAAEDPSAANQSPGPSTGQRPDDGSVDRNIYTNRFFGFSFQFPENWTPLSADDARVTARLGAGLISGGDQTLEDVQRAGAAHTYPLLFVTPDRSQGITSRSIQIQALDSRIAPEIASAKDFLEGSARILGRLHSPIQPTGSPMPISIEGKQLWRLDLAIPIDNNIHYASEIVAIRDGFILLFVLSSPDKQGLDDLAQCMNSLHFLAASNPQLP